MKRLILAAALIAGTAFGQTQSQWPGPNGGSGGPPTGAAGGGLNGTYPNPGVNGLTGSINPVNALAPDATTLGCVGDNSTDNTTCLTHLVTYLNSHPFSSVQFPAGRYRFNGTFHLTAAIDFGGAGSESTYLIQTNATADGFFLQAPTTSPIVDGVGAGVRMHDIAFAGLGSATTGNLVVANTGGPARLQNIAFVGHGGTGLLLATERTYMDNINWSKIRRAVAVSPNWSVNESYLQNFEVQDGGCTADVLNGGNAYNYNVNSVSGTYPASGAVVSDQHAAFDFDQNVVNFNISKGSIKRTCVAGFKVTGQQNFKLSNLYFEGFTNGFVAPSVINGGNHDKTITSAAMTNSALVFDVVDGSWFGCVLGSASDLALCSENGEYINILVRPPDFLAGSGAASSLGGGITRGMYEYMAYTGLVHNAAGSGWHVNVNSRATGGSTAQAWPAGAVMEKTAGDPVNDGKNGIGLKFGPPLVLADSHFNSVSTSTGYTITTNANNEQPAGEVITGFEPDLYYLWGSANAISGVGRGLVLQGNNVFPGSAAGQGIIETYGFASVDVTTNPLAFNGTTAVPTTHNVSLSQVSGQFARHNVFTAGSGQLLFNDSNIHVNLTGNTPTIQSWSANNETGALTVTSCTGCVSSGSAGGVLAGAYPNPTFATSMTATGANLAPASTLTLVKGNNSSGSTSAALSIQEQDQHAWMMEWHVPGTNISTVPPQGYIDAAGAIYMGTDLIVSGHNSGNLWQLPDATDAYMLGVWADVPYAIVSRPNLAGNTNFQALSAVAGNYVFSIEDNGHLQFGGGATHASMDTCLNRSTVPSIGTFLIDDCTGTTTANGKLLLPNNNGGVFFKDSGGTGRAVLTLDNSNQVQLRNDAGGNVLIYPGSSGDFRILNNAQSLYSIRCDNTASNCSFGSNASTNYKADVQKSGSSGTFKVGDQTASTGATRVLFALGAADTAGTNIFTINGSQIFPKTATVSWGDANNSVNVSDNPSNFSANTNVTTFKSFDSGASTGGWDFFGNGTTASLFRITPNGSGKSIYGSTNNVFTVATLPSCAAGTEGYRAGVNDALTPVALGTVTGGGTSHVPVYCNGTNWIVN